MSVGSLAEAREVDPCLQSGGRRRDMAPLSGASGARHWAPSLVPGTRGKGCCLVEAEPWERASVQRRPT